MLDSAGAGIAFIRKRQVVRCNLRYAEIFGYSTPEQLIGQRSEGFYPDLQAYRELTRAAYPVVAAGDTFRTERSMRRREMIGKVSISALIVCSSAGKEPRCE